MARLAAAVPLVFLGACYLAHERGSFDGGPLPDSAGLRDAGRDSGPGDAGPPRMLRWVELAVGSPELPGSRLNHFAVVDEARDRMILIGGWDPYCCGDDAYRQDVWELDLASERWRLIGLLDRPLLAIAPIEAAFDAPRNRVVVAGAVFSARDAAGGVVAVDLDTLEISRLPDGPWPGGWLPIRAAHDRARARVIANDAYYIGRAEGVWALDLATDRWSTLPVEGSPGQLFHAPLTVTSRGRGLIYSGYTGDVGSEAIWELDTDRSRFTLLPTAAEPEGRFSHRAVFEPVRGTLVVFGGTHFTVDRGTLLYDEARGSVSEPSLDPAPGGRRDHSFVLDPRRRRAIVFGGAEQSEFAYDDTWALELP